MLALLLLGRMRWCFLHRLRAAPGGAQTPAMRARYDAGEVVEGGWDLYTRSHTCALQKRVYWECSGCAIEPMQASHVVGPRGGPIGGPKCASESERFCEGLSVRGVCEPADGLRQLGTSGFFSSAS